MSGRPSWQKKEGNRVIRQEKERFERRRHSYLALQPAVRPLTLRVNSTPIERRYSGPLYYGVTEVFSDAKIAPESHPKSLGSSTNPS